MLTLVTKNELHKKSQEELNALKTGDELFFEVGLIHIYKRSLYTKDGVLYYIAKDNGKKSLYLISESPIKTDFTGDAFDEAGLHALKAPLNVENSRVLRKVFPFTSPISLRDKKTTIGSGDRLGLATAAHVRAARKYDVYPVLAQQSIRELSLTGRNYAGVVADAVFLVFQEGFERGYGADGDHLKTLEDIDVALEAGMPMITLDLSEVMNADAADWSVSKIEAEFAKLEDSVQKHILDNYAGKTFNVGSDTVEIDELEAKKCTLMYKSALDFAKVVDNRLREARGDAYDLEISIDETTTPTLPAHHLFISSELKVREVTVNSLAPRFIGEFQKGIDYIGDIAEFEKQFIVHCEIAKAYGNYKVSVHSGSDKFSVYPIIGKYTGLRLHLKTAGTSWLEAVRAISKCDKDLYKLMHKKAFEHFDAATKLYHITADITKIRDIEEVTPEEYPQYLEQIESRQLLHITYGGLLNDPAVRTRFFNALNDNEDVHYDCIEKHIEKHISLLGAPKL